jgi:endonuclease/exonuclease/phosphatase family metal-dependent hydrolase
MRRVGWKNSIRAVVAVAVAAVVAVGAPSAAGAGGKRELKVMTQNLYLGSSLAPALGATTQPQLLAAVATIYDTVVKTDFRLRAKAIADEILAEHPDIIGLEEVSNWIVQRTNAGPDLSYDFLQILQTELKVRELDYTVAKISNNANIGPVPLFYSQGDCRIIPAPPTLPDCAVTLRDRDVILVNADNTALTWSNATADNFDAQEFLPVPQAPGQPPVLVSFNRGWASIEASLDGAKFRFVVSHLEVADFVTTQEAQARELVKGPLQTLRPVVLVGDFNSAADGSTTRSYAILLKALFADAWWTNLRKPGFTCCQAPALDNPTSTLDERVDLVLVRLALPTSAKLVGDTPIQPKQPIWASDHAGVVATVLLF